MSSELLYPNQSESLTSHDSRRVEQNYRELVLLLKYLAEDPSLQVGSEKFSEKLDRLGKLLSRHFKCDERCSPLSGSPSESVVLATQAHNVILQQYVQLLLDLMANNPPTRAEIVEMINGWLTELV